MRVPLCSDIHVVIIFPNSLHSEGTFQKTSTIKLTAKVWYACVGIACGEYNRSILYKTDTYVASSNFLFVRILRTPQPASVGMVEN